MSSIFAAPLPSVNARYLFVPFDPTGSLDDLVAGELEGRLLLTAFDHDYQCRELTDPTLDDRDVPAEVVDIDPAGHADRAWWLEQTAAHCPADVSLPTYRAMCDDAGLGPVGFCDGFEPDARDWPSSDDAPLPTWDKPALACS